jgi:hypothetical protein
MWKKWRNYLSCGHTARSTRHTAHSSSALHAAVQNRVGVWKGVEGFLVTRFTTSNPLDFFFWIYFMFRLWRATLENLEEGIRKAFGKVWHEMLQSVWQETRLALCWAHSHRSNALWILLVYKHTLNISSHWGVISIYHSMFVQYTSNPFRPSVFTLCWKIITYPINVSTLTL